MRPLRSVSVSWSACVLIVLLIGAGLATAADPPETTGSDAPETTAERTARLIRIVAREDLKVGRFITIGVPDWDAVRNAERQLLALRDPAAVDALIEGLHSGSGRARAICVEVLGQIGGDRAVPAVVGRLQGELTAGEDTALVQDLGKLGARAVPELGHALETWHGQPAVRAARMLGLVGSPDAIAFLMKALGSQEAEVRIESLQALARCSDKSLAPAILPHLHSASGRERAAAVEALGTVRDPQVVGPLIEALKDPDSWVRAMAARGLAHWNRPEVGEALVAVLEDAHPAPRSEAAWALGLLKYEPAVGPLTSILSSKTPRDSRIHREVAQALASIGTEEAQPALIQALGDESSSVRNAAVRGLGNMPWPGSEEALVRALNDSDSSVRRGAAEALTERKWEPRTREDRVVWAKARGDWSALADMGRAGIDVLVASLADDSPYVREGAARALGRTEDPELVGALADMLHDPETDVAAAAAGALGEIDGRTAVSALRKLLADDDVRRAKAAARALQGMNDRPARPQIADFYARHGMWAAMAPVGPPAVHRLLICLRTVDGKDRAAIAAALGAIGDARAVAPLCRLLRDDDAEVRAAAADALGKIGSPAAIDSLTRELEDPSARVAARAVEALARIGSGDMVRPLTDALTDPRPEVRAAAARALGSIGPHAQTEALIAALGDPAPAVEVAASEGLLSEGDVDALARLVRETRYASARSAALNALGRAEGAEAFDALKRTLSDERWFVRAAAVRALRMRREPQAIALFVSAVSDDAAEVRSAAAWSLGGRRDPRAQQALVAALPDPAEAVRAAVWSGLARTPDWQSTMTPPRVDMLMNDAASADCRLRVAALAALGGLGDRRSIPVLVSALLDVDREASWQARNALEKMGWQPETETEKIYAALATDGLAGVTADLQVVESLLWSDLTGPDPVKAANAAYWIAEIGEDASVEELVEFLIDRGSARMAQACVDAEDARLARAVHRWAEDRHVAEPVSHEGVSMFWYFSRPRAWQLEDP